eukprot:387772-Pelagomonas_calceolata.AAC.3
MQHRGKEGVAASARASSRQRRVRMTFLGLSLHRDGVPFGWRLLGHKCGWPPLSRVEKRRKEWKGEAT